MPDTAPSAGTPTLPTNAREALAGRAQVLGSLTAAGAIRGGAAELTGSLQAGWLAERRLIDRILADTPGDQSVFTTLDRWEERTRAFSQKAGRTDAAWTDKQGEAWRADQVLGLIADLRDRLSAWVEKPQAENPTPAPVADPAARAAGGTGATSGDRPGHPAAATGRSRPEAPSSDRPAGGAGRGQH